MKRGRTVHLGVVSAAILAALTGVGWAHSFPEGESPAAGETLTSSPPAVSIKFDAPIEQLFAKLSVLDAQGKDEAASAPEVSTDDSTLSVKLGTLKPGDYKVQWAVVCIDSHHTEGSYTFTVAGGGK